MAEALREWLPCVVQACDPWISSSDIDAGVRWGSTLAKELQKTQFGILCLTPENLTAQWLLFEAGALSKFVDNANVCPCLLGVQPTDITGPLAQFQSVEANKEGAWSLVKAINNSLGDQTREEPVINKVFEALWPDFEASIKAIPKSTQEPVSPTRTQEDLLEEVLTTVRRHSMILSEIQSSNYQGAEDTAFQTDTAFGITTLDSPFSQSGYILPGNSNKMKLLSLVIDVLLKYGPSCFEELKESTGIDESKLGNIIGYMRKKNWIHKDLNGKYQVTPNDIVLKEI